MEKKEKRKKKKNLKKKKKARKREGRTSYQSRVLRPQNSLFYFSFGQRYLQSLKAVNFSEVLVNSVVIVTVMYVLVTVKLSYIDGGSRDRQLLLTPALPLGTFLVYLRTPWSSHSSSCFSFGLKTEMTIAFVSVVCLWL